jgi:ATP-dependent 26S proteasome regulatory subunit
MDGFEENDRIVVVAATNLAATLDPALLRPGRFDRKVEVTLPSKDERKEIFKIHLKNKTHSIQDHHLESAAE